MFIYLSRIFRHYNSFRIWRFKTSRSFSFNGTDVEACWSVNVVRLAWSYQAVDSNSFGSNETVGVLRVDRAMLSQEKREGTVLFCSLVPECKYHRDGVNGVHSCTRSPFSLILSLGRYTLAAANSKPAWLVGSNDLSTRDLSNLSDRTVNSRLISNSSDFWEQWYSRENTAPERNINKLFPLYKVRGRGK